MTIPKKDKIAYWSSEAFLNQYFYQLKFNEPYSKATGSIAGGWVRNPWDGKMQEIAFSEQFKGIETIEQLRNAYFNKKKIIRLVI